MQSAAMLIQDAGGQPVQHVRTAHSFYLRAEIGRVVQIVFEVAAVLRTISSNSARFARECFEFIFERGQSWITKVG